MRTSIEKVMIFLEIDNKSIDFLRKSIEQILIFLEIDRKTGPAARNRGQGLAGKSEELAELQNIPQYRAQERAGDHPRTGRGPVRKHYFFVIFWCRSPAGFWPGSGQGPAGKSEEFAELQYTLQYRSEERVGDHPRSSPGPFQKHHFSLNFF